jgi:hypothetical protein
VERIWDIHKQVKEQLKRAQQWYKEYLDRKMIYHQFSMGDLVWYIFTRGDYKEEYFLTSSSKINNFFGNKKPPKGGISNPK